MLNKKTRLGGDDDTITFVKVCHAVFTENSHAKGGGEKLNTVNVRSLPSLSPYYNVRVLCGD